MRRELVDGLLNSGKCYQELRRVGLAQYIVHHHLQCLEPVIIFISGSHYSYHSYYSYIVCYVG